MRMGRKTEINSGSGDQLVDEIDFGGSGNNWTVDSSYPGSTKQAKIDQSVASLGPPFTFTGTYTLHAPTGDVVGSATVTFIDRPNLTASPEPGTIALLAAGGLAALFFRWVRRSKAGR